MPTLGRQRSSTPLNGYGLDVLHPSPPNNDSAETQVDIVFVHGLGGTSQSTWSKEGVFWPRDLLKEEFPRARIMTVCFFLKFWLVWFIIASTELLNYKFLLNFCLYFGFFYDDPFPTFGFCMTHFLLIY